MRQNTMFIGPKCNFTQVPYRCSSLNRIQHVHRLCITRWTSTGSSLWRPVEWPWTCPLNHVPSLTQFFWVHQIGAAEVVLVKPEIPIHSVVRQIFWVAIHRAPVHQLVGIVLVEDEAAAEAMFLSSARTNRRKRSQWPHCKTLRATSTCPSAWVATTDQWSPTIAPKMN
jgi:hypothetical protein